jgi:hypothetical protein
MCHDFIVNGREALVVEQNLGSSAELLQNKQIQHNQLDL